MKKRLDEDGWGRWRKGVDSYWPRARRGWVTRGGVESVGRGGSVMGSRARIQARTTTTVLVLTVAKADMVKRLDG